MGYTEATNLWDALDALNDEKEPSFRIESDEAFPINEILTPEQKAKVLEISDSLDKKKRVERSGETEMSHRDDSDVSKDSFERGKSRVEDEPFEQNAILTAQNELNGLLDQLEPKRPTSKEQIPQTDPAPSPSSHVPDLLNCTAPHGLDRCVRVTDRIPGPGKGQKGSCHEKAEVIQSRIQTPGH